MRLKSIVTRLFVQQPFHANIKENIKASHYLCEKNAQVTDGSSHKNQYWKNDFHAMTSSNVDFSNIILLS